MNRVGDVYFDQIQRSGHAQRVTDLDRFAQLGIRTLRYPVLWERTAPDGLASADWTWAAERLARLRELGIRPIVTLLHHGSGPRETNLLDPNFPIKFAAYARAVAERFPWIELYTPINEPLTTARFSCLYGWWYPHARDDGKFLRALLNQCRATVLAMRAIRAVNPSAKLVQTEDLGKVHSTPALRYQADFENERRWLTFDLLSGCVTRQHPLWDYIVERGIRSRELRAFLRENCPPDIVGLNYYVTGERFLDERLSLYPVGTYGGNGTHDYADVEAVRARRKGVDGARALVREAWERYQRPLAITEAHMGCTREEQMRWLYEIWQSAQVLRRERVDLRAVTAWALLGTFDWDSLVTREQNHYEPGLFDLRGAQPLRGDEPRPTALAHMAKELATRGAYDHPVLDVPGWWHRPERLLYGKPGDEKPGFGGKERRFAKRARPLLISGGRGTLGCALARLCEQRGLAYHLLTHNDLDIADVVSVENALEAHKPWAVINAAGYAQVDNAEREPRQCRRANTDGPVILARACERRGLTLLTFSSDLVFDGALTRPYVENDPVAPLNVYGKSKADAEQLVLDVLPSALIIRASAFFGPWDDHNFATHTLRALASGKPVVAAEDAVVSPTYVPDLGQTSLDLLIDGEQGIWHVANEGAVSWFEWARWLARRAALNPKQVRGAPMEQWRRAPRPPYSALGSVRGIRLPALEEALERYMNESAAPNARSYRAP